MPLSWRNRRNYFFTPPLWYFHRALAGRDRHNTFHGTQLVSLISLIMLNYILRHSNHSTNIQRFILFLEVKTHVVQLEGVDWFIRENGAKHHTNGKVKIKEYIQEK